MTDKLTEAADSLATLAGKMGNALYRNDRIRRAAKEWGASEFEEVEQLLNQLGNAMGYYWLVKGFEQMDRDEEGPHPETGACEN